MLVSCMTRHIVYSKPAVSDEHYDEYDWRLEERFDNKSEAVDFMPNLSNTKGLESEMADNYVYCRIGFDEDEDIPSTITEEEKRKLMEKQQK